MRCWTSWSKRTLAGDADPGDAGGETVLASRLPATGVTHAEPSEAPGESIPQHRGLSAFRGDWRGGPPHWGCERSTVGRRSIARRCTRSRRRSWPTARVPSFGSQQPVRPSQVVSGRRSRPPAARGFGVHRCPPRMCCRAAAPSSNRSTETFSARRCTWLPASPGGSPDSQRSALVPVGQVSRQPAPGGGVRRG